jgi:hypothetical protein
MQQEIPARIGPVEFLPFGKLVIVKAPREFEATMRRAGARWDPGRKAWWIDQRRIGPVIREVRARVDPLFRAAGLKV